MNRRGREIETLLVTMFAAAPLYVTGVVGPLPVAVFHLFMAGIVVRVARGKGPELVPPLVMRVLAVLYVFFYLVDAFVISRSAIAASTHLVLFIAAYQPIEGLRSNNQGQRMLTTAMIFIASLATSTHIAIVLFVIAFAFLMFRQMMYVSHLQTVGSIGRPYALAPMSRAALFYAIGAIVIGAPLFPLLPRLRNPLLSGITGSLRDTSTGLSDSINFNEDRSSTPDGTVVARVWMGTESVPFFTPLRLRGNVYDRYSRNEWARTENDVRGELHKRDGAFRIARPVGFTRVATVQQLPGRAGQLYVPVGTWAISGLPSLYAGSTQETFTTWSARQQVVTYEVSMARQVEPYRLRRVTRTNYPVTPPIAALAQQIAGNENRPMALASRVERHLTTNFQYLQQPESLNGRPMTVDEFLLTVRRGHCEYFAAGMVALMTALDVPARIVGGFYSGQINPFAGYIIVRRQDAHAWVEVWDGTRWVTFDPTPPSLRPGNAESGIVRTYATAFTDAVNYFWDRYILTFGLGDQIELAAEGIARARDAMANARLAAVARGQQLVSLRALAVLLASGFIVAVALLYVRHRQPVFHLLARELEARGVPLTRSMTMEEALRQLADRDPAAASELAPLVRLYEEEQFSLRPDRSRAETVRRRLRELSARA